MHRPLIFSLLLPLLLSLSLACAIGAGVFPLAAADEAPLPSEQLAKSLQTWKQLKARCDGNYSYKIRWQSWAGFGHETVVVVRDNKVVERQYSESTRVRTVHAAPGAAPPKADGEGWIERDKDLGSHTKGAPLKTLDELYDEAQKVAATKLTPTQRLYLTFDANGLLQTCCYSDTRIAGDAPQTGVTIAETTLEPAKK